MLRGSFFAKNTNENIFDRHDREPPSETLSHGWTGSADRDSLALAGCREPSFDAADEMERKLPAVKAPGMPAVANAVPDGPGDAAPRPAPGRPVEHPNVMNFEHSVDRILLLPLHPHKHVPTMYLSSVPCMKPIDKVN